MRLIWLLSALFFLMASQGIRAQYGTSTPSNIGTYQATQSGPQLGVGDGHPREWEFHPTLSVEETYTDNLRLKQASQARSDWVSELKPGFIARKNGARARLEARYTMDLVYRAQEGTNDLLHDLDLKGNAELVKQLFFIDVNANVSQQNVSALGPVTATNVNVTENRTTVGTFLVSPYLRYDFGTTAQGEARFTYSKVGNSKNGSTVNAADATDSDSNRLELSLGSGPSYKSLKWNIGYSAERIDYDTGQNIDVERAIASVQKLITTTLGLKASAGYENNNYVTSGPAVEGSFWSIGPEWTPTPRTRLAATAGKRFGNSNYTLDFKHRTRLTTWSASYSEEFTTQRQELLVPTSVDTAGFLDSLLLSRIPDAAARQQVIQALITQTGLPASLTVPINFFTTTPFLLKRFRASFGIQGIRNTVLANVFTDTREATSVPLTGAGDFNNGNTKQTGTSLIWDLRMSEKTSSNVSLGYTRSEFLGQNRQDNYKYLRLGLTRQFQPKLSGSINYRRLENSSNQPGSGYTENAVSASLNMKF